MTDRVDAAMDRMEPPSRDSAIDRVAREAERGELSPSHDAVLPRRKLRKPPIHPRPTWSTLTAIMAVNANHPPSVAP